MEEFWKLVVGFSRVRKWCLMSLTVSNSGSLNDCITWSMLSDWLRTAMWMLLCSACGEVSGHYWVLTFNTLLLHLVWHCLQRFADFLTFVPFSVMNAVFLLLWYLISHHSRISSLTYKTNSVPRLCIFGYIGCCLEWASLKWKLDLRLR